MARLVRVVQYLTLAACGVTVVMLFVYDPAPEAITVPAGHDGDLGAAVFASRCASCHGEDGEGGYGPALDGDALVVTYPEVEDQLAFVRAGTGTMPGFASDLTPEELEAVVAFTRDGLGSATPTPETVDPRLESLGAQVFADTCTGCHGKDGGGGFGPQLAGGAVVAAFPDPADQRLVIATGRGAMPAYEGNLSADEIDAVVAYTRSLP